MRPPSSVSCSPRTIWPRSASGFVDRSVPSARFRSGVVNISSVGMFATYSIPAEVRYWVADPQVVAEQSDREIRAGAAVNQRIWPKLVQRRGAPLELGEVLAPGGHRVRLVEPHAEGDVLPQALEVGLTEHLLRPARAGGGDDRPVDRSLLHLAPDDLRQLEHPSAAHALAVEVREQLRLGVPRRGNDRLASRSLRRDLPPFRRIRQRLV